MVVEGGVAEDAVVSRATLCVGECGGSEIGRAHV